METVIIVVPDNVVLINGKAHTVNCSAFPTVSAVQWNGTQGHVEFAEINGQRPLNEMITDISPFQSLIDAWRQVENRPMTSSLEEFSYGPSIANMLGSTKGA